MSRLTFRAALSVVISLVIIAGVYASIQALSLTVRQESKGMYVLSSGLVNPLQKQSVIADGAGSQQLEVYKDSSGRGHDCESGFDSSDY